VYSAAIVPPCQPKIASNSATVAPAFAARVAAALRSPCADLLFNPAARHALRNRLPNDSFVSGLTARAARAAERSAIKTTREIERAEKEVREAERAQQAERDAAIEAERAKAESGERERALQAKQKAARDARYAARKSRPKRR
jgi:uncharacterized protein DUF6481